MEKDLAIYLKPGRYVDSDSPLVMEKAKEITRGCLSDKEKAIKIHQYVRDLPFDIIGGFRMLLSGKDKASDFIKEERGFCMHKAAAFVALCRASDIPARIIFEIVECPDKPFFPEKMRKMYGKRPQPWHSGEEVYLNGKWIKADCTVDREQGEKHGRKVLEFDGIHDLFTVEGPVLKERGSAADMPEAIVNRHRKVAATFLKYMESEEELPQVPDSIIEGEIKDLELILPGA